MIDEMRIGACSPRLLAFGLLAGCASFRASDETPNALPDAGPGALTDGAVADAPVASDAGDTGCAHEFCSGFDRPTTDEEGWVFRGLEGATVTTSGEAPRSPPAVLRATFNAGTVTTEAYLRKIFEEPTRTVRAARFGYAFRVKQPPSGAGAVQQATFGWGARLPTVDMTCEIQLSVGDTGFRFRVDQDSVGDAAAAFQDTSPSRAYSTNEWITVRGELTFDPQAKTTVKMYVADEAIAFFNRTFDRVVEPTVLEIGVGVTSAYSTWTTPSIVDFDDVWVDLER